MEIREGNKGSESPSSENLFAWDDQTQLYFHASSGFYHDPNDGWYYSSKDGRYYKFENGNYVLLESDNVNEVEMQSSEQINGDTLVQDGDDYQDFAGDSVAAQLDSSISHAAEAPAPPSEWLEDTLIDLFLSGYNQPVNDVDDVNISLETDDKQKYSYDGAGASHTYEIEEGEWVPEDCQISMISTEEVSDEACDEEKWLAQYGQVIHPVEEPMSEIPAVDLWDWQMAREPKKDGKGQIARLIGRLVKQCTKVHPAMPSGGSLLKTAPICEVHLDLVRVTTGKVYKLRSPSSRYLASLSTYDSSNPTKGWAFPELSVNSRTSSESHSNQNGKSKTIGGKDLEYPSLLPDCISMSVKRQQKDHAYRDRAAERRALHKSFGVGPGQKVSAVDDATDTTFTEGVPVGVSNTSFGAGSYARRILEGMGWKEGESLGSSQKGLVEPLQPVGNIGSAGLGWPKTRDYRTLGHYN